jgi:DNA-binding transcriptional ArsR family regulator
VNTYTDERLSALGDPTRRSILERLRGGPLAVGRLAESFPVSRPAISQHLRVLKQAGLVRDRAVGNRRLYELDATGLESLRDYFDGFWTDALGAFRQRVEAHPEEKPE